MLSVSWNIPMFPRFTRLPPSPALTQLRFQGSLDFPISPAFLDAAPCSQKFSTPPSSLHFLTNPHSLDFSMSPTDLNKSPCFQSSQDFPIPCLSWHIPMFPRFIRRPHIPCFPWYIPTLPRLIQPSPYPLPFLTYSSSLIDFAPSITILYTPSSTKLSRFSEISSMVL